MTTYSMELMCNVVSLTYDFRARAGRVVLDEFGSTDMSGAINYFRRVDPDVIEVATFRGEKPDVVYRRGRDGLWASHSAAGTQRGNWCDIRWEHTPKRSSLDEMQGIDRYDDGKEFRAFLTGAVSPQRVPADD
ncbi:hypothetical protein E8L99_17640 [Phreatobacter aquaticus]|uniref:Uncharacterized protein n=1 Tax=Phreatobacter aquaticus TaxID=2570229 RepID=A0A4D7QID3_9HYPH|nr:hypothetical protein [Phreatobacter aquaticus]QCK87450.1 hypothetical protein E8L99_17640 [Phreatobacter aquaticus]